jgi:riboflavin kinase/FMN adenylyltransferase
MTRVNGQDQIEGALRGAIIALGNFDGFHLGHQAVAGRAMAIARELGAPAIIATFDPHPVRHFQPDAPPFRLTTLDQRERLFTAAGADAMMVYHFDGELAAVTASDFITDWLIHRAGARGVVTGEDFTFGKGRGGSTALLHAEGEKRGLIVETVGPVTDGEGVISSSRIRDALRDGDCALAARLLTRPFAIEGAVQHGAKLGRTIGMPTANIVLGTYLRPKYGIYAVRGRLPDGRLVNGAANLGIRPSFDPPVELLETFFFDFSEDLYGQTLEIELIAYLRPEAKFDSLDALTAQMQADCEQARQILADPPILA